MSRRGMAPRNQRSDALSKERIVEAAIALLDSGGEQALTFRALAAKLETGSGAIYWHIADKDALLAAATDHVIAPVLAGIAGEAAPQQAIREMALGLFDTIDAHPWAGPQLFRDPGRSAMPQIFERVGAPLMALGLSDQTLFDSASALVHYILGVAGQNAANPRLAPEETDREAFLGRVAAQWLQLDAQAFPFVHRTAAQLRDHDDRAQFLFGINLILAGIAART
jgi:AcrR family transcriptional regulator